MSCRNRSTNTLRSTHLTRTDKTELSQPHLSQSTMQYILAYLAALAAVNGSPVPQGVTEDIAPQGGMPAGCKADYPGTFGIAVMTGTAMAGATATEAPDGQPAAATQMPDGM